MTRPTSTWASKMAERKLSAHFTAADICCAGDTWARLQIENEPKSPESWTALALLCETVLEPVLEKYSTVEITYGFSSPALYRKIPAHAAPALDQHASCERNSRGNLICKRRGAAVDFLVPNSSSVDVAIWVVENLPFDRLYFYGKERPLHVSMGPDNTKSIVAMLPGASGRRIPRNIQIDWLKQEARFIGIDQA